MNPTYSRVLDAACALSRRALPLCVALLAAVAPVWPHQVQAQEQGGGAAVEGALFLLLPVSARSVAMARAMTALQGPESVWWNPAGIMSETEVRAQVHRGEDLAGEATSLSVLMPGGGLGNLALSYQLTDLGEIERRDQQGNFLGTVFIRNHTGVLTLAGRLGGGVAVGLNVKLVQQRVTCRGQCDDPGVEATNVALDGGLQWTGAFGLPLTLGAAAVHLGSDVQFFNAEQSDPLPSRVRVAAAYDVAPHFIDSDALSALVTVELEDRWRSLGTPATYVGTEVSAGRAQALIVRAGYVFGAELQVDGAAVGVGLRTNRIDLGLSKSLVTNTATGESEPAYITLGITF